MHFAARIIGALCACLALLGCERSPAGGAKVSAAGRFNVILIVLDACRADKLGCYGFDRETSPNIDTVAADPDAVLFERHHVQGSWTKPSTASLFTGQFLHRHGVSMGPERKGERQGNWFQTQALPEEARTMAEYFHDSGFFTLGVVKSWHLTPDYGYAQGFDRYISPKQIKGDRQRVRRFLRLIDSTAGKRFFAYLHLNACHHPFAPRDRDPVYMASHSIEYSEQARRAAGIDFTIPDVADAVNLRGLQLDRADAQFLNLIYEAKLRRTDGELVGPLLERLRSSGIYDSSLIVITADHGEELYEHRGYAHQHALWEEVIRVPLIVKFPKGSRPEALGRKVTALTSSVDILPALLAFAGAQTPDAVPGKPIFSNSFNDYILAEQGPQTGRAHLWALIHDNHKLIETISTPLLFNLAQDPGERRDLAASDPDRARKMRELARDRLGVDGSQAQAPVVDTELPPEAIERLRQLGYMDQEK